MCNFDKIDPPNLNSFFDINKKYFTCQQFMTHTITTFSYNFG